MLLLCTKVDSHRFLSLYHAWWNSLTVISFSNIIWGISWFFFIFILAALSVSERMSDQGEFVRLFRLEVWEKNDYASNYNEWRYPCFDSWKRAEEYHQKEVANYSTQFRIVPIYAFKKGDKYYPVEISKYPLSNRIVRSTANEEVDGNGLGRGNQDGTRDTRDDRAVESQPRQGRDPGGLPWTTEIDRFFSLQKQGVQHTRRVEKGEGIQGDDILLAPRRRSRIVASRETQALEYLGYTLDNI